jgi:branched-chain amino acid transport system substrate-binding protein
VHAQGYDAMTATVQALEKARAVDKTKFRDALKTVEFDGVRGRFKFDEKGDPTLKAAVVIIKSGQEVSP